MTVGELSDLTGVPVTTLRYYDRIGLLRPERLPNNHRAYPPGAAQRLKLIELCQALGCTLDEVALVLSSGGGASRRELASRKLAEIDERLAALAAARAVLSHLATCLHTTASAEQCRDEVGRALRAGGTSFASPVVMSGPRRRGVPARP
jgi:MerR family copper efflux transcriptional regulator